MQKYKNQKGKKNTRFSSQVLHLEIVLNSLGALRYWFLHTWTPPPYFLLLLEFRLAPPSRRTRLLRLLQNPLYFRPVRKLLIVEQLAKVVLQLSRPVCDVFRVPICLIHEKKWPGFGKVRNQHFQPLDFDKFFMDRF